MNTRSKEIFRSLLAVVLAIIHAAIAAYIAIPFLKPLTQWIFSFARSICNTQHSMGFFLTGIPTIVTTGVVVALYVMIATKIILTLEKYILVWALGDTARKYLNRQTPGSKTKQSGGRERQ